MTMNTNTFNSIDMTTVETHQLYTALDQIEDQKAERSSAELTRRWHVVAAELARRGNLLDYDPLAR